MPILDPDERLRQQLGEMIPGGGSDADTLFSDDEIDDLLEQYPDMDLAVYEGWKIKAAKLSNLVDTTEGNSQRKFSQLLTNATTMLKTLSKGPGSEDLGGRSRVGKIKRPPVPWGR